VYGACVALHGISAARPIAAETLTRLEADSLGGTHVVLPTDDLGQPSCSSLSASGLKRTCKRRHIFKIVREAAVRTEEQMQSNCCTTFAKAWRF
jgi:hypothetical protein